MKAVKNDGSVVTVVGYLGADYTKGFRCVCIDSQGKFQGIASQELTALEYVQVETKEEPSGEVGTDRTEGLGDTPAAESGGPIQPEQGKTSGEATKPSRGFFGK